MTLVKHLWYSTWQVSAFGSDFLQNLPSQYAIRTEPESGRMKWPTKNNFAECLNAEFAWETTCQHTRVESDSPRWVCNSNVRPWMFFCTDHTTCQEICLSHTHVISWKSCTGRSYWGIVLGGPISFHAIRILLVSYKPTYPRNSDGGSYLSITKGWSKP